MGTFYVTIQVADRFRERYVTVDALVDTGSSHTSLPEGLLDELGIEPERSLKCELADNRVIEYPVGEIRLRIEEQEGTVPVLFTPDDELPLLGATTLEILGFGIDPIAETLLPVKRVAEVAGGRQPVIVKFTLGAM